MMLVNPYVLAAVGGGGGGAAHQYWRLTGFQVAGGFLEMTEFQFMSGATNVNSSATLTSSDVPDFGAVTDLVDGNLGTRAYWTDTVAEGGGFFIRWDFGGSPPAVDGFRMAGESNATRYPSTVTVESSDDGTSWTTVRVITGATWGGNGVLSSTYSLP